MAIYHFSAQVISRAKGQSSIACASYRSGDRLTDEQTGEVKFYEREIEPDTMIIAPAHSPEWVQDRQRLWNEVEKSEKRKDSQLAREIKIALPRELSSEKQRELIQGFAQKEFVDRGMIADLAIHRDDPSNPHAHMMLTTREITEEGFAKKNREWNDRQLLDRWREQWADHVNHALEREGFEDRISHLSHEERGLETLPTKHLGHEAHAMEKKGIETELGNYNREIEKYNATVIELEKYRQEKESLEREQEIQEKQKQRAEQFSTVNERVHLQEAARLLKTKPELSSIQERLKQIDKWENRLDNNTQYLNWKDRSFKEAGEQYFWIESARNQIKSEKQKVENLNWKNPLRLLENRTIKHDAESRIAELEKQIEKSDRNLDYFREKLGFKNHAEFKLKEKNYFDQERAESMKKNMGQRKGLVNQRETLLKAQSALEIRYVRELASRYPDSPEIAYMSYEKARQLDSLNKETGKVLSVQDIQEIKQQVKRELQNLGDRESVQQQTYYFDRTRDKPSPIKENMKSMQSGIGMLDGIIQGMQQAGDHMKRKQQKNKQQGKSKGKKRYRNHENQIELGE